jgi:hypothetical protein
MKKFLVVAIALIASFVSYSQDNFVKIDEFYQNKEELIIHSKVIDFPGKTKQEIVNGFKNWASTNFVNLKEVIVSESDDQIVLNYISKQMYVKSLGSPVSLSWYVRLIVEFNEEKMRATFIDDGNSFWAGNQYAPSTPARRYNLALYFKDGESQKKATEGLKSFKASIITTASSIKLAEQKKMSDNW